MHGQQNIKKSSKTAVFKDPVRTAQ